MKKNCIITIASVLIFVLFVGTIKVHAKNSTEKIQGLLYEYDKKGDYEIPEKDSSTKINTAGTDFGSFTLEGDIVKTKDVKSGYLSYEVNDGNVTIKYDIKKNYQKESDTKRYVTEDKSKKVNGEKLDSKIGTGAIILQTSFDADNWFSDVTLCNVGSEDSKYSGTISTSHNIQQEKGCYYRVLVAYATNQKEGKKDNIVEYLELYKFYLVDGKDVDRESASPDATPKSNLGKKEGKKKNDGYTETREIDDDDPHFGWDIGQFYVNGFTSEVKDPETGNPVFLKKVGDKVALWFRLDQDIDCLNGNKDLSIAEDKKGYDQEFEVEKYNMGKGSLMIRVTGKEGQEANTDPIIYKNYLAANAHTGAQTNVELFEEGDYEVVLDYKIKKKNKIAFTYTTYDYQIKFDFSVRNGNCMVFPMDLETGAELFDRQIAPNGFKLDFAKSKYLDINVTKSVLNGNASGGFTEEVRSNAPAKDGETYEGEGIYTFDVKNKYTGESTTKVIYVGDNKYYRALATNKISVEELNLELMADATIDEDGTIYKDGELVNYIDDEETLPPEDGLQKAAEGDSEIESEIAPATLKEKVPFYKQQHFIYFVIIGSVVIVAGIVIIIVLSRMAKLKRMLKDNSKSDSLSDKEEE